jgi:hypothetical protein
MATIEPRLIHLLNSSQTPDLPPIQLRPLAPAASQSLSLPPLKPDFTGDQLADRPGPSQIQTRYTGTARDDLLAKPVPRPDDKSGLLTASIRPLQLLLAEPEVTATTIPLRMIVDDVPETPEDPSTKKRHRTLPAKEDFVQLPQPLKKQKSAQQVVPPIIAGLHEPPPDPAVFPPITSASFDDGEQPYGLAAWKEFSSGPEERSLAIRAVDAVDAVDVERNPAQKAKRRAMKPRKKWSEEETNNLLLGVSRHGVGRWTTILEDPDFKFNGRTAGDLKDRFRTCCPEELRVSSTEERLAYRNAGPAAHAEEKTTPKTGWQLENILIPTGGSTAEQEVMSPSAPPDSDAPKRRKSRAHRKRLEDLAELGIHGPFEKSHRRKRRPFTRQDDREILDGLEKYGPSWTRIQRDPKYNLSTRQPTDLRDRVRNKYPEIYAKIEKANLQVKDATRGKNVLEPSVNMAVDNARNSALPLSLEPHLNRSGSKENISRRTTTPSFYESTESLPGLADLFDMNEGPGTSLIGGPHEMDLSHLLLDDSHVPSEHPKFGRPDAASNRTSPAGGHADPGLPPKTGRAPNRKPT